MDGGDSGIYITMPMEDPMGRGEEDHYRLTVYMTEYSSVAHGNITFANLKRKALHFKLHTPSHSTCHSQAHAPGPCSVVPDDGWAIRMTPYMTHHLLNCATAVAQQSREVLFLQAHVA